MTELNGFLLARIAEDEAAARQVGPTRYQIADDPRRWSAVTHDGVTLAGGEVSLVDGRADALVDHNARHQPGRVLAECAAKKAILNEHSIRDCSEYEQSWGKFTFGCEVCDEFDGIVRARGYCPTLRALASVYADHAAYQQQWAI